MDAPQWEARLRSLDVQRIAIIKPSAFGDVVQCLPLLPAIRRRFPLAEIDWVINQEFRDLLTGHPEIAQLHLFRRRGTWRETWELLTGLRDRHFDLVFDLQGLLRSAVMTWSTRAPLRLGLQTARECSQLACHGLLPDTGRSLAAYRRYWRVAEFLRQGDLPAIGKVPVSSTDQVFAREIKIHLRGPMLVVHPSARWETKQWPIEHFATVAGQAVAEMGCAVVVVGSGGEAERAEQLVHLIREKHPRADLRNLAGQTTLKQLAALLEQADLVLSCDSGPMHLAAAMGAPVVGVFTCTNPAISGPAGLNHACLSAPIACAGSYCKRCPYSGEDKMRCFRVLTPEHVWQVLAQHWVQLKHLRKSA